MDVFISWSGPNSHAVASALRDWLPLVLQQVQPFFSEEDIRQGERWATAIAEKLEATSYAIVCLTPDNLEAPWLLFEAGAVSKDMRSGRVMTLLVGLAHKNVTGPLAQFHHALATKVGIRKIIGEINSGLKPPLADKQLEQTFEIFWPQLEIKINEASRTLVPAKTRSQESMLEELLELSRASNRSMDEIARALRWEQVKAGVPGGQPLGTLELALQQPQMSLSDLLKFRGSNSILRYNTRDPSARTAPTVLSADSTGATENNETKGEEDEGTRG